MKVLLTFLAILSATTIIIAQQEAFISCSYRFLDSQYTCQLYINNPNNVNNFTEIGGTHLDGYSNGDVISIISSWGNSTIIPSIICRTFRNIEDVSLSYIGFTAIEDSAFGHCLRIRTIRLPLNSIESISANAFSSHDDGYRNLQSLDLSSNRIQQIEAGMFSDLENLQTLNLE